MKEASKEKLIIMLQSLACFAIIVFITTLTLYGLSQLITRPERQRSLKELKFLQTENSRLRLRVETLKRTETWSPILNQLLSPVAKAELDLLAEQLKQRKKKTDDKQGI